MNRAWVGIVIDQEAERSKRESRGDSERLKLINEQGMGRYCHRSGGREIKERIEGRLRETEAD